MISSNDVSEFLPSDTSLPFFSYGLFKPGQLGFLGLGNFVESVELDVNLSGILKERDGLPLLFRSRQATF